MNKISLILLTLIVAFGCKKDKEEEEVQDFRAENEAEILQYLEDHDLTAEKTESGLYYIIDYEGWGNRAKSTSLANVSYKGYFTDGKVFDESTSGLDVNLNGGVIRGWTEGIPFFKEGGNGVLLIPAHLGYGSNSTANIPGGSVLIFDITLNEVFL